MKKKIIIIVVAIFSFFVVACGCLFGYYVNSLGSVETNKDNIKLVNFTVDSGSTTTQIIDSLYEQKLIKNKYTAHVFVRLNSKYMMQAGSYELNNGMTLKEILTKLSNGEVIDNSISVTFVEGNRITNYVKVISKNFGYSEDDIFKILSDKEYLQELIDKYWFLTEDILNDKLYYALEGYLFPSTYKFEKDASVEEIIGKMLDTMGTVLKEYESEILNSKYTVHEILTLSSVIQNEGKNVDFKNISSVFHNRLNSGMKLESCATSYYGVKKDFTTIGIANATMISANNAYNTYIISSLPIGPISSPSKLALEAAIVPSDTEYYFFLSDNEGKTYFQQTYVEHQNKQRELDSLGKWDR